MKYTRKRKGGGPGDVNATQRYALSAQKANTTACDEYVKEQVALVTAPIVRNGKKEPWWQRWFTSEAEAIADATKRAKESSICQTEKFNIVPDRPPPGADSGPQGTLPQPPVVGCTGPACGASGGRSRRRKTRGRRRRITRRR